MNLKVLLWSLNKMGSVTLLLSHHFWYQLSNILVIYEINIMLFSFSFQALVFETKSVCNLCCCEWFIHGVKCMFISINTIMTAWVWSLHTKYNQASYSGEDYVCRHGFFTPLVSTASAYRWADLYSSRVVTYWWWALVRGIKGLTNEVVLLM